ncbi:hypothetical protein IX318_000927 [Porphyromonas levii]|nr:hypothetical protein [Porphyromonas levii]MBR8715073.1 hypothetical protein [Porphyromonas levii]MBR8727563.1 hypothetical protein [Porphyromonas levii]MBR8735934.1 hypothetical protein [Porphyromonas levii]MBR8765271.1 hypothetical protein [Porphyromonas levii]
MIMSNSIVNNRYDFILLFDVKDGNPNGDPDGGNLPRIDPETGEGLVTDVCLKRKVRNYVEIDNASGKGDEYLATHNIFVKENSVLNDAINEAVEEATGKNDKTKDEDSRNKARSLMCDRFYDIRTFGGVLSTGNNAGQVRGPIQLTFARSIDPIFPHEHTITRMAATDAKEQKENEDADDKGGHRTMGRKATVPYGLYKAHGFVTPHFAKDTGFTEQDLELFWEALQRMFDLDHSAARGLMAMQKIIIFKHESALGNAPAHQLFERVTIKLTDPNTPPRSFEDYKVEIKKEDLPNGIEIIELI